MPTVYVFMYGDGDRREWKLEKEKRHRMEDGWIQGQDIWRINMTEERLCSHIRRRQGEGGFVRWCWVLGRNRSFDNSDNGNTSLQEALRVTTVVEEFGSPFKRHNTGALGLEYTLSREIGNFFQCPSDVPALLINLD